MAKRLVARYEDDLDGTRQASHRCVLALDDETVVLELSGENHDSLVEFLKPFFAAGEQLPEVNLSYEYVAHAIDPAKIRLWAAEHQLLNPTKVQRGRISAEIYIAYLNKSEDSDTKLGSIADG